MWTYRGTANGSMAMWKHVKQEGQANGASLNLSVKDTEEQNSISKALNVAAFSKSQKH